MRIGCDLVHIPRIARLSQNEHFLERVFHPDEVAAARSRGGPEASLAARFAAKEAFTKALGTGIFSEGVSPREIWVENEPNGRPRLHFTPSVENKLKELGLTQCDVSLSHQGEYAMAVVILFGSRNS